MKALGKTPVHLNPVCFIHRVTSGLAPLFEEHFKLESGLGERWI